MGGCCGKKSGRRRSSSGLVMGPETEATQDSDPRPMRLSKADNSGYMCFKDVAKLDTKTEPTQMEQPVERVERVNENYKAVSKVVGRSAEMGVEVEESGAIRPSQSGSSSRSTTSVSSHSRSDQRPPPPTCVPPPNLNVAGIHLPYNLRPSPVAKA